MLLRLCVAVFLITGVRTVLADPASTFEASLAAYQAKLPSGCQIKSPAMKVIYACSKIQGADANPRFQSTIDAGEKGSPGTSSNGVNFCYNSLVEVQRDGGRLTVNVTRDSGQSAKMTTYVVNQANLTKDPEGYVLPIDGLKGLCFGYTAAVNSNCGFGTDVTMALRVSVDEPDGPRVSITAERDAISQYRRNGSQLANLRNKDEVAEAKKAAIAYARKQLAAHAKLKTQTVQPKKPVPPGPGVNPFYDAEVENFRQCDQMLINLENAVQPPIAANSSDEELRAEYRRRIQNNLPYNPAPMGTIMPSPGTATPPKTGR